MPDICEVWATADLYGMGPGVYPADKTPIDHPNGWCFLTDVIRPPSEWGSPKEEPRSKLPSNVVAGILIDATKGEVRAAEQAFAETQRMVASGRR